MAQSNINTDANIPEMDLDKNYSPKKFAVPEAPTSEKDKSGDKIKKELDKLKGYILKKYPFTKAISILPPQSIKDFIEEETENLNKEQIEKLQKKVHLNIIIPDEKVKDIYKIKKDIIEQIEKSKQEIWIYMRTPSEIWEICTDQKFELYAAMAMSFPLHDKGILGAMRVTEIHKSLVLQKFEKYVVSYVLGGSLIRGEASKDSDVDVFVIINDTDVKRMPRL